MGRKILKEALEKRMEREQNAEFNKAKKEPIKTTKYIIIVFSFIGIFNAYNEGTFFQNLFPYALLGLYDNFIYSRYTIGDKKKLIGFINFSKVFFRLNFLISTVGYFGLIKIQNNFILIAFEGQKYALMRSYVLFFWVVIYYLLMGAELYLPLERGEIK